jgi:hypothetical protein
MTFEKLGVGTSQVLAISTKMASLQVGTRKVPFAEGLYGDKLRTINAVFISDTENYNTVTRTDDFCTLACKTSIIT